MWDEDCVADGNDKVMVQQLAPEIGILRKKKGAWKHYLINWGNSNSYWLCQYPGKKTSRFVISSNKIK